jgi:hypothetical protein
MAMMFRVTVARSARRELAQALQFLADTLKSGIRNGQIVLEVLYGTSVPKLPKTRVAITIAQLVECGP